MYIKNINAFKIVAVLIIILACVYNTGIANSENFPEKPIQIILPFTVGTTDLAARSLSSLTYPEYLSQPIVIVSKPGAGGSLGVAEAAKANADGYTLVASAASAMLLSPLVREVPYSYDDFIPICRVLDYVGYITVRPDAPWQSLEELIEYSRENKVRVATCGTWTQEDLVIRQLNYLTGTEDWIQVPFDAGPEAAQATMAGVVDVNVGYGDIPLIQSGKLRALVTLGDVRYPHTPDIPTIDEVGYKGIYSSSSMGIYGQKEIPQDIINILEEAFYNAYNNSDFMKELIADKLSASPIWMGSADFDQKNRDSINKIVEILSRGGWQISK